MGSISILLCGMAVVIGGILVLRMHAFLALLLGALTVAVLTPAPTIFQSEINSGGWKIAQQPVSDEAETDENTKIEDEPGWEDSLEILTGRNRTIAGGEFTLFRRESKTGPWEPLGKVQVSAAEKTAGAETQTVNIEVSDSSFEPEPGDMLVSQAGLKDAEDTMTMPLSDRIAAGFGRTTLSIGILIALASIVGECLLNSGAAQRVVVSTRNAFGEERTPWAFLVSGFVVAIPVFFDTVFLLLMPLAKAMRLKTGKNYLMYILTIVAGGTMAHSLVPPTPGPLLVASELGVSIGAMIIGGTVIGSLASIAGYAYAAWANRRWEIPLRDSAHSSNEALEEMANRDDSLLPPLWLSLSPILLPVLLIAGKTVIEFQYPSGNAEKMPGWVALIWPIFDTLGQKNIAMIVATALGMFTLVWHNKSTRQELTATVQAALTGGAVIILITGAGGSFGMVLRQTNIAGSIQDLVPPDQAGTALLFIGFFVTAVIRVAQGSATVAMITAVGIVGPLAAGITLPYHPLYLALAVGCGSKPLPWMNDSGFWMIGRMSGMTEAEMLKTVTITLTIMGIVGMFFTVLGAWFLPLV